MEDESKPVAEVGRSPLLEIFLMVAWFGLAVGLLESALLVARRSFHPVFRLGKDLLNRHYLWLVPVADLMIFAVCGSVLCLIFFLSPRAARRLALYSLCGLAFLVLLKAVPGLYMISAAALAGGLASLTAPSIEARSRRFQWLVRRSLPWLVSAVAALALFSFGRDIVAEHRALSHFPAPPANAPNVVLIVMDTVRADALSLYGYGRETSPNLERLARRGVRFDQARSTAPWTLPSHASMFTGMWPYQLSAGKERELDATYPTLAEVFRENGYLTAGFVANSLYCHLDYGLGRGFTHYEDVPLSVFEPLRCTRFGKAILGKIVDPARFRLGRILGDDPFIGPILGDLRDTLLSDRRKDAAQINNDAMAWISKQEGRPFFIFVNYYDAHAPYLPPRDAQAKVSSRPLSFSDSLAVLKFGGDAARRAPWTVDLARDYYDDCIAYVDDQVGRLYAELKNRGLLDNTIIIITSDHGEHFGEHGGTLGHTQSLYDQEIRVPLIVLDPRRAPSTQVVSTPVSLRNLPATALDLAGLSCEPPFPGKSLARFWRPTTDSALEDPVLFENENEWRVDDRKGEWSEGLVKR